MKRYGTSCTIKESLLISTRTKLTTSAHRRAPPVAELERSDDSTHSLIDVDSPHISSVPSDFESQSVQTDTQAARLEREAEEDERRFEAAESRKREKARAKAKQASEYARDNANNPVILGNSIAVLAIGSALGFGAYRKYAAGELTWRVVGVGAGVVGLFAAADYYLSK